LTTPRQAGNEAAISTAAMMLPRETAQPRRVTMPQFEWTAMGRAAIR
jgi:hypothetical protein